MTTVQYEGREWRFTTPTPAVALTIRRMQDAPVATMGDLIKDAVMDWMDLDDWVDFHMAFIAGDLPEDAIPEIFMRWLEVATGKPFSAVVALSSMVVKSWGIIRGRLVMSGIPNPAEDIKTLAALIDAADVMIREGHKDEKATAKYEREVYKPRAKQGSIEKPAGFEQDDMKAQMALLDSLGD